MRTLLTLFVFGIANLTSCGFPLADQRDALDASSPTSVAVHEGAGDFPDFKNFKFPHYCFDPDGEPFSLVSGHHLDEGGGELNLSRVTYADVTHDGTDEALVILGISTGGTSHPYCVYIFAKNPDDDDWPSLLWTFESGDRADGGLRQVNGENGRLVVETYIPEEAKGDCCPTFFVRNIYGFDDGKFTLSDSSKLRNPDPTAVLTP